MLTPIWRTRGRMIRAATVCEMKVAMTRMREQKTKRTLYRLRFSTRAVMPIAIVCSKPDEVTALPRHRPPAARMMIVQRKLLKSSLLRIPVPKKRTRGIIAMTPMSPKMCSSWWLAHQRTIVKRVTMLMKDCMPVQRSLTGRIGMTVALRPGRKVTSSRTQMRRMEMMQTGSAMKNHVPQLMFGSMFCRAMMFWGEAIGDAAPPTLAANAIPNTSALAKSDSGGMLRSKGWMIE